MPVVRTNHRILSIMDELETFYHIKRDKLPNNMELLEDGYHVAIYLTEQQFQERQGDLFPRDPLTGAFCKWDSDYEVIGDLF